MRKRLLGGIRLRLALAISITTLVAVVLSFLALEQGTEQDLKRKIDAQLVAQHQGFAAAVETAGVRTPVQLERVVNRFVKRQRYNPASRILVITVNGRRTLTNQQQVLDRELEHERLEHQGEDGSSSGPGPAPVSPSESGDDGGSDDGGSDDSGSEDGGSEDGGSDDGGDDGASIELPFEGSARAAGGNSLVRSPVGFSTIETREAGQVRVLTKPIFGVNGKKLGTFRAADPLASVELTREGLRNTFLIVGLVALLMSATVAIWLASVITRPLRRMARFVSGVDPGDLTDRLNFRGGGDEVEVLADSFDGMLDRLERAFKRQQDFVSDASHELRTPLTVVRGQIELLQRGVGDPAERERTIDTVLAETDRMNRLVDDMLVLARAEEGTLVHRREVDVEGFFEDVRRDLPLLGDRNYQVTAPSGSIEMDPDRVSQVLRNLVRNAVAHTGARGTIVVVARASLGVLEVSVTDDGPGIPADQVDRIFDRFHRTDEGRTRDQGGSGLGLAIARAIVEAHDGRIWAESPPGKGATIRFELPGYRAVTQAG